MRLARRSCLANGIPSLVKSCPIVPAELGDGAGILGGVSLIQDAIEGRKSSRSKTTSPANFIPNFASWSDGAAAPCAAK
ncbi:MAG: hypothetical protein H7145_07170 [Akkermansiaceae bacterium]|nr:hypothetical protein [Armatimonadota bacterium]